MILVVDHNDSFVHNLARYVECAAGLRPAVVRHARIDVQTVHAQPPSAIVLSPGPCAPRDMPNSLALIRACSEIVPILGVCLGHQCIGEVFGGRTGPAFLPLHGQAAAVRRTDPDCPLLAGLPEEFTAGRYHSLIVGDLPQDSPLTVTARSPEGEIMAVRHRNLPVFGVQFHPESVLTDLGAQIIENFVRLALGRADLSTAQKAA